MRSFVLICAAIALGLAGCAVPEEAGEDTGEAGRETPEYITVDGATYECDDQLDADGICDGYQLNEGQADEGYQSYTATADGMLMVGGHTFRCDDTDMVDVDVVDPTSTQGRCEHYDRDE